MNKVMTRVQRTTASRPPGRRDSRRPTGTPPRTPGGGTPRTAPGGSRPPAAPRTAPTRPTDNRPSSAPARVRPTDLFADRLLDVLSGRRPVHAMLRHTLGSAYDDLAHLAEHGPLRTTHGTRPVVRDIGYYVARPGALEVFARIGAGHRVRAMAFRLELGRDHRWRCTAIELDGPRETGPRTG